MVNLPASQVTTAARELRSGTRSRLGRSRVLVQWALEILLFDITARENSIWLCRAVVVLILCFLPGQLLLRALRVPLRAIQHYPIYLLCGSIAVVTWTTVAVDLIGPVIGVQHPVRIDPILIGLNVTLILLIAIAVRVPTSSDFKMSLLVRRARWTWPLVLPLASVVATARLDNRHGNSLVEAVLIAVGLLIPVGIVLAERLEPRHLGFILYGTGLALMLLTSMRSSYVVGYDISSEFYDFHQTVASGVWHLGQLNPYEAMLSLTVLPASLHALIGGPETWIFKLGYPALFAAFPVAVYSFASRYLSRRPAFVAASIVVVQSYFFQQQPEIARQELALVVFAGIMGALLDERLRRSSQIALVIILSLTVVVTHYATTYVAIILCLLVIVFRVRGSPPRVLPWVVSVVSMSLAAIVWYGPLTHSSNNVTYVVQTFHSNGLQFLPGHKQGENPIISYFDGVRQPSPTVQQYQRAIAAYYRINAPYIHPLPEAAQASYALSQISVPNLPDHAPRLASVLSELELVAQQGINALGILAAVVFTLRRNDRRLRTIGLLGIACTLVLALSRLSGTFAADYNSSRLFLQCLFIYAPLEAGLLDLAVRVLSRWKWCLPLLTSGVSLVLLVVYVGNTDLAAPVTGGNPPFALYNSGEDYLRLFVTRQEMQTVEWLAGAVGPGRIVYADNYGQLQLDQFTSLRRAVFTDVTPLTIDRSAWVYASTANVSSHLTWGDGGEVHVMYPSSYLDRYYDVVYSTGSTEVYHR